MNCCSEPPAMMNTARRRLTWSAKLEKLTIGSLDNHRLHVVAQYNPKDLQIDKQVSWLTHNRWPVDERRKDNQQADVEINQAPSRSMSIELLFDGYEEHRSIQPEIDKLEELSSLQPPRSKNGPRLRPHYCVVTWGVAGARPFRYVIESLSTKVMMFAPSGAPLRVACTVKLKEVHMMSKL
ncbi:MAG: hypothetical protein E6J91_00245 [Deltaproteobacteria bacterium]|nr:MAG: hypothetical protein E6J91_00245 [Deltaproteobacteria bacterium]